MISRPGWLKRYREGERGVVWHELRQLGAAVREDRYASEAQAVCDEMAQRARRNIDIIIERLMGQDFRFHENDDAETPTLPFVAPTPQASVVVDQLEERFGVIPMTLSSWIRIVGDVWLVGTHPRWRSSSAADPLVLEVEGSRKRILEEI